MFTVPNFIFTLIIASLTSYLTFPITKGGLTDRRSKGWNRLTKRGKEVFWLSVIIILILALQECNSRNSSEKENKKLKNEKHISDSILNSERDTRDTLITNSIKRGVDSNSKKLYEDISLAFAKQGLKLDTVNKKIESKNDSTNKEIYGVLTEANSIPIISASVYLNMYRDGSGDISDEYTDKYLIDFQIKDYGDYDIHNVLVKRLINYGKGRLKDDECPLEFLRSEDSVKICNSTIIGDRYIREDVQYPFSCSMAIKWKLKYYYYATIRKNEKEGGFYIDKSSYSFNGVSYFDVNSLVTAMRKILAQRK